MPYEAHFLGKCYCLDIQNKQLESSYSQLFPRDLGQVT